jgi:hypothetical protein
MPDVDEPVRLFKRKRLKKHGVYDAKDDSIRADAQRKHNNDDHAERAPLVQAAQGMFELGESQHKTSAIAMHEMGQCFVR